MKNDLVVLGDVNLDVVGKVDDLPVKGGCAYGSRANIIFGGSGLNTSVGASRLGLNVALVSKIGTDDFGEKVCEFFDKEKIDTTNVVITGDYPTGFVFSAVTKDERTFFSFRNDASDIHLKISDLPEQLPFPRHLYITGVSVIEGKETFFTFLEILKMAKGKNVKVFFDPNLRDFRNNSARRILQVLELTDVFLPNESEIETICKNLSIHFDDFIDTFGIEDIWVKKGSRGCELINSDFRKSFKGKTVKTIDSTGAGDAFDAALIWGYIKKLSFEEIGSFANLYAAKSTERLGSGESYPYLSEIKYKDKGGENL